MSTDKIRVAAANVSPVWMDKAKTLEKAISYIEKAAAQGCHLVAFGESFVPGYPFWLDCMPELCSYDNPVAKDLYALLLRESVNIKAGDLDSVCARARDLDISVLLGVAETDVASSGGHSVYASAVFVEGGSGQILSAHRKLVPTHNEKLVWAYGDGNGLRTHKVGPFNVSRLNCGENWNPLARASLYAQGTQLHVAMWPGSTSLTENITRFVAREARAYVVSAGTILRREDVPDYVPHSAELKKAFNPSHNGGSCLAGPNGQWLVEPRARDDFEEFLLTAEIDLNVVCRERQTIDAMGHYSRPDVTQLTVNRERLSIVKFTE